jgi:hypothetical protein
MTHERDVFINCPFDAKYRPLLRGLLFAVHDCGFRARSALEVEDSGEVRVQKIVRIIAESPFGIHDISRVEADPRTNLPRFNMPLELGLFLGAKAFGDSGNRPSVASSSIGSRFAINDSARTSPARTSGRTEAKLPLRSSSFEIGCRPPRPHGRRSFPVAP